MEDREAGGTAEEQADVTGRTGTSGELPGSVGGADASQPDGVGGADGERPNSSQATSLLQAAHEQLSHLDWALLMLIPAAELQAVDRTLSLDPGRDDGHCSTLGRCYSEHNGMLLWEDGGCHLHRCMHFGRCQGCVVAWPRLCAD